MTKRRRALSALSAAGVLLVGAAVMILLTSFKAEAKRTEQVVETRTVRTRTLQAGPQVLTIRSEGFLEASRSLDIQSPVAGQVTTTLGGLKGGFPVREGDRLLALDDRRAGLAWENSRTETIRAASAFIPAAGLDDDARRAWNAYVSALGGAEARSLPSLPPMSDRERLLAATLGVVAAAHAMESAALDLLDHEVLAPFSGVLIGDGLTEGSWVAPGTTLAVLVETGRLELRLPVTGDDLRHLAEGDEVRLTRPGDDAVLVGSVDRIEPMLRSGSQTARVHVSVRIPEDSEWIPGTYVSASIRGQTIASAYRVPRGLLSDGRLPVFDRGTLALRPVTVLAQDATDVLIAADLPEGTEMVTTVLQNPIDGLPLTKEDA